VLRSQRHSQSCTIAGRNKLVIVLNAAKSETFAERLSNFSWSLRRAGIVRFHLTFCGYKKLAIFTTNVHTNNECLINQKTVIRSTEPPISCRCFCKLAFCPSSLSSRCIYVLLLSFILVSLCLACVLAVLKILEGRDFKK